MKCMHCNSENFEEKNTLFSPEIVGKEVEVVVPAFVCVECGASLMNSDQVNGLRKAAADRYRQIHGLLTSEEIAKSRTRLGMSQTTFARYLNIDETSVKRWETYYVQDVVQDRYIREKTQ